MRLPDPSTDGGANVPAYASTIIQRDQEWWEEGMLPRDELVLVVGDPGAGKSTWIAHVAASLSAGRELCGRGSGPAHNVLLYASEQSPTNDVVPRLRAADADLSHVRLGDIGRGGQELQRLALPQDMGRLRDRVRDCRASLLVLDPVASYIAAVDATRDDASVRQLLDGLRSMAVQDGVTVICTKHYRKSREGGPLAWIGGAASWAQVPRVILALGQDPDNPESRILAVAKCNIGSLVRSKRFHCEKVGGSVKWVGDSQVDLTAEDIGLAGGSPAERDAMADAEAFLLAELSDDERLAKEINSISDGLGISRATLRRAKVKLGILSVAVGAGRDRIWFWRLPAQEPTGGPAA